MGRPQVPPQAPPIIFPPNVPEPLNRSSLLRKRPGSRAISKRNVAISKLRWCRCKGAALSAYCPVSDPRYLWLTLGLKPIWAALSPWLMQEAMRAMVFGPDLRRVRMPAQGARCETSLNRAERIQWVMNLKTGSQKSAGSAKKALRRTNSPCERPSRSLGTSENPTIPGSFDGPGAVENVCVREVG